MDTDPESFGVHPDEVEKTLTPGTAGIIAVHIGGIVSRQMPALRELAGKKGIWLVEDAAHAHGSSYAGISAGAFGIAGSFSFYPTKVMTSAEGGMIVTDDDRIAKEARIYRDQGKAGFTQNTHIRLGYNWRMSEPHAIIGLRHLQRLPEMIRERQRIAAIYDAGLREFKGLQTLRVPVEGKSNYYKYIVRLGQGTDRKRLKMLLRESYGVSLSGEVYEEPLHKQPIFERYRSRPLPVSEDLCASHVCLPLFPGMEEEDSSYVLRALREALNR
jgi:dTDP-4-amino-4,6-dideoxygalactose transaminase